MTDLEVAKINDTIRRREGHIFWFPSFGWTSKLWKRLTAGYWHSAGRMSDSGTVKMYDSESVCRVHVYTGRVHALHVLALMNDRERLVGKIAYKLLHLRKDGSLGPQFINRRQRIPIGKWLKAESHPRRGYAVRPGWHCAGKPEMPHLSTNGRVWCKVEIENFAPFERPRRQGGLWFLANRMRVLEVLI